MTMEVTNGHEFIAYLFHLTFHQVNGKLSFGREREREKIEKEKIYKYRTNSDGMAEEALEM